MRIVTEARGDSEPDPRHRFALMREVPLATGSFGVLDVEVWSAHFAVRYALFPASQSGEPPTADPDNVHMAVWEAVDDSGRSYVGVGGWAEGQTGDRWTWMGEVLFAPTLPTACRRLHLHVPVETPNGGLSADVELGRRAFNG